MPASTIARAVRSLVAPAAPIASTSPWPSKASDGAILLWRWSPGRGSPNAMSDSPRRLFSCTSSPGTQTPAPTPSEWERTHALPAGVDRDHVGRVLRAVRIRLERLDEGEHAVRRGETTDLREPGEERGHTGEAAARRDAVPVEVHDRGVEPARPVVAQVAGREDDAVDAEDGLGERAAVCARGPFLGEHLERRHEPRLLEELAGGERPPVPREEVQAALPGEDGAEHLEGARMHLR